MHQFVRFGLCYNSSGLILKYTGTCGPLTMTKCRLFIKKDHRWIHQLLLSIYYCSTAICCPEFHRVFNCWDCFQNQQKAHLWRELKQQSIYRYISNNKTVVNKSNQLIGGPLTISHWRVSMASLTICFVLLYSSVPFIVYVPNVIIIIIIYSLPAIGYTTGGSSRCMLH